MLKGLLHFNQKEWVVGNNNIIKKKRNVLWLLKIIAKWNKSEKTLFSSCIQQCMQMASHVKCVALDIPRSTS